MQKLVVTVMNRYGYMGILLLIMVENLFPPIPSEIILPFGGFMTTYTNLSVWGVIFVSTVGSAAGGLILYRLGMLFSPEKLERLLDAKACRLLGFKKEDVEHTMNWFNSRGKRAVLFGRCVPIVRSLISIPAGMAHMELSVFCVYTVIGSAVWNFLLVSLGALLGASWGLVQEWLAAYSQVTRILLWIAAAGLICWITYKRTMKKAK